MHGMMTMMIGDDSMSDSSENPSGSSIGKCWMPIWSGGDPRQ